MRSMAEYHDSGYAYMIQPAMQQLREVVPPRAWQAPNAIRRALIEAVIDFGMDSGHIVVQAAAYYKSPAGRGEFFLLPATFIRDGHYDDDPEAWRDRKKHDTSGQINSTGALERIRSWRLEA